MNTFVHVSCVEYRILGIPLMVNENREIKKYYITSTTRKTAMSFSNLKVTLQPLKAYGQSSGAKAEASSQFKAVNSTIIKLTAIFNSFQQILKKVCKAVLTDSFQ